MRPRRYPYSGKKKESNAILNITIDSKRLANVSNLKGGRLKEMSWTNMCKIADALEVSLDELR